MNRIDEIQSMVNHWEHKREMTDDDYRMDYIILLAEISRLQIIVNNVSKIVSGEAKEL